MQVAFANAHYRMGDTRGRNAHIAQFISNSIALGHQVWGWPGNEHPDIQQFSRSRLKRWQELRNVDVLYIRLQEKPPGMCRYSHFPYRQLIGSPFVVWEFNTVPEFSLVMGEDESVVLRSIEAFKSYGRGCDLAVCVTRELAAYVRERLGIQSVLVVPNGSDPDMFRPDIQPFDQVPRQNRALNVVWIGSADLSWHNIELVFEAADILFREGRESNINFHVIGGKSAARQEPVPPNISLHDGDRYENIPRWLAAMDIGLCLYYPGPADFGSPLKLFDYMASGLAVIASDHPQMRRVLEQLGQPDMLIPSDAPELLANLLLCLAADRERLARLGIAGRQLVVDYYNWRRAVKDTFEGIAIKMTGGY